VKTLSSSTAATSQKMQSLDHQLSQGKIKINKA